MIKPDLKRLFFLNHYNRAFPSVLATQSNRDGFHTTVNDLGGCSYFSAGKYVDVSASRIWQMALLCGLVNSGHERKTRASFKHVTDQTSWAIMRDAICTHAHAERSLVFAVFWDMIEIYFYQGKNSLPPIHAHWRSEDDPLPLDFKEPEPEPNSQKNTQKKKPLPNPSPSYFEGFEDVIRS